MNEKREIDKYTVTRLLGKGAYGQVYLAHLKEDAQKKPICLKFLSDERDAQREIKLGYRYFQRREEVFPGQLQLPDVELKCFTYEKFFVCVLPYISGKPLYDYLLDYPAFEYYLTITELLDIATSLVEQMILNKSVSQLHRDIKADNIMIVRQPQGKLLVVLIDFSFATDITDAHCNDLSLRSKFDEEMGSSFLSMMQLCFFYNRIAPEHRTTKTTSNVGFRSDSYSLNSVFSEIYNIIRERIKSITPTTTEKNRIDKFHNTLKNINCSDPIIRPGLEEIFLAVADDQDTALERLNLLLNVRQEAGSVATYSNT